MIARYSKAIAPVVTGIMAALIATQVVDEAQGQALGVAIVTLATTALNAVAVFLAPANK
jgi:hypothetical protein